MCVHLVRRFFQYSRKFQLRFASRQTASISSIECTQDRIVLTVCKSTQSRLNRELSRHRRFVLLSFRIYADMYDMAMMGLRSTHIFVQLFCHIRPQRRAERLPYRVLHNVTIQIYMYIYRVLVLILQTSHEPIQGFIVCLEFQVPKRIEARVSWVWPSDNLFGGETHIIWSPTHQTHTHTHSHNIKMDMREKRTKTKRQQFGDAITSRNAAVSASALKMDRDRRNLSFTSNALIDATSQNTF